jgi:hypothetical protein
MADEPRLLPLFPLHTVLFPFMELPIRVFEPRYRQMLDDCASLYGQSFGVVLIRSGREVGGTAEPHPIGTVAYIENVEKLPDGALAVATLGQQRFHIRELTQRRPYLLATVDLLPEPEGGAGLNSLATEVRAAAQATLQRMLGLNGEWVRRAPLPRDPLRLSYAIAERLPLDLPVRQELLEAASTADRLGLERPILRAEARRVEALLQQRNWLGGLALN